MVSCLGRAKAFRNWLKAKLNDLNFKINLNIFRDDSQTLSDAGWWMLADGCLQSEPADGKLWSVFLILGLTSDSSLTLGTRQFKGHSKSLSKSAIGLQHWSSAGAISFENSAIIQTETGTTEKVHFQTSLLMMLVLAVSEHRLRLFW